VIAALIVVQTARDGHRLATDARAAALSLTAVLAWRRAPFLVVVLAAAATAVLLRALGGPATSTCRPVSIVSKGDDSRSAVVPGSPPCREKVSSLAELCTSDTAESSEDCAE
jgi:hypothetical protein